MWCGVPVGQTTEESHLSEETHLRQKDAAVEEAGNLFTQRPGGFGAELPRRDFPGSFLTTAAAPSLSPPASLLSACERLVISPEPTPESLGISQEGQQCKQVPALAPCRQTHLKADTQGPSTPPPSTL